MFDLPLELVREVYSYDAIYKHFFQDVVLAQLVYTLIAVRLLFCEAIDLLVDDRYLKKVVRCFRKAQLKELAKFTRTKLPRRLTKKRALVAANHFK